MGILSLHQHTAAQPPLAGFGQLAHGAQAARTDIDGAGPAINFKATAMHIEHKATACAMLGKWHIIAMHRLALAYITTACWHINFLPKISMDSFSFFQGYLHFRSVYAYLIIPGASGILHQ